ncbi:formylglycine-generating enzyme family protein [Halalkalibaculum sp. DA3122]|uniref:formylglycine-generating enzyme family protein n=1 Tax=Halalkalibaculum sp. DA3122 TaxID=3373607 RepID=UPI0037545050
MMKIYSLFILAVFLWGLLYQSAPAQPEGMVAVEQDTFMPFYSSTGDSVTVDPFYIDIHPVTNAEFLEFVKENEKWRRSRVKSVFAGDSYLRHWATDLELGRNVHADSPVTNVSWFAARAYARWKGTRLPTLDEWEYVASASAVKPLASRDKAFVSKILDWYSRPNPDQMPAVGERQPNYHGVHDMHGLIWEWVQDFNTVFITGESRADEGELKQFYCAAGSSAAADSDKANYAAFLRYAFRGSLEADFAVGNLGFRCARDKE